MCCNANNNISPNISPFPSLQYYNCKPPIAFSYLFSQWSFSVVPIDEERMELNLANLERFLDSVEVGACCGWTDYLETGFKDRVIESNFKSSVTDYWINTRSRETNILKETVGRLRRSNKEGFNIRTTWHIHWVKRRNTFDLSITTYSTHHHARRSF